MADHDGVLTDANLRVEFPGRVAAAYQQSDYTPFGDGNATVNDPLALDPDGHVFVDTLSPGPGPPAPPANDHSGYLDFRATPAIDWFERFHVLNRRLDFGNILSQQVEDVDLYNAFRRTSHDWDTFINNAGVGVSLLGLPSLPVTIGPQSEQSGLQVQVDIEGPPSVNSTLDYTFDVPQTIKIPITFERVILLVPGGTAAGGPEAPYIEILEFLTDVIKHKDGSEQRHSPRKRPRQLFEWQFILEDGPERSFLHNIIFEWQARMFGVPIWHEMTFTTSSLTSGVTQIPVQTTDYSDFRVGDLVVIYQDNNVFDVQGVGALTSTLITTQNPIQNSYPKGVKVMPVRTAVVDGRVTGGRFPSASATLKMRMRVTNNDIDIGSTAGFNSFNGKVLFDGCNGVTGTLSESFDQEVITIDNLTGVTKLFTTLPNNRHTFGFTLFASGRQAMWEARQVLHSLRGKQISFYLPSFSEDLTVVEDLSSGGNTMDVTNVGMDRFVQEKQPRNVIRVVFKDGSTPLIRTVLASTLISNTVERLTMDSTWPSLIDKDDIKQVEYVQKLRFDTDRIQIQHQRGANFIKVQAPVKTVLG